AIIASAFLSMFRDQCLAQIFEISHGLLADQKLIGIRAPVLTHRNSFAAPDEFRAAPTEMLPTSNGQRTGPAVRRPIPAFHRLDGEPVADAQVIELKRLRQRRDL